MNNKNKIQYLGLGLFGGGFFVFVYPTYAYNLSVMVKLNGTFPTKSLHCGFSGIIVNHLLSARGFRDLVNIKQRISGEA